MVSSAHMEYALEMERSVQAGSATQERHELIVALPRPRPLRRTAIGNFTVILATVLVGMVEIALLIHLYFLVQGVTSFGQMFASHKAPILAFMLVPVLVPVVRAGLRQQRWLVSEGEVAVATIRSRYPATREWRVVYEFEDRSGKKIAGEAMDSTGKHFLVEGERMLVYYMASNPHRSLAQCMASYEPVVSELEPDPRYN